MPKIRCAIIMLLGCAVVSAAQADNPMDEGYWVEWGHMAGADGPVYAFAEMDDLVVLGGNFTVMGPTQSPGIAAWNRVTGTWQGYGAGFGGVVRALAVHDGSLYAGGYFSHSGSMPLQNVAVWRDEQWQPVGGLAEVRHLASYAGDLYAVALSNGNVLLRWTGAAWEQLAAFDGNVNRLLVCDDLLVLAGDFVTVGEQAVDHVVAWDGATMIPAYQGIAAPVRDLTLHDGALVAANAYVISRWDGSVWTSVAVSPDYHETYYHLASGGGQLFAHMTYVFWEAPDTQIIYRWNGSDMEQFGNAVCAAHVSSLHADAYGGLWIGGDFAGIGPVAGRNVQHHDGTDWVELFPDARGIDGPVFDLVAHDGALIAGGNFFAAGAEYSPLAAAWNGSDWSPRGDRDWEPEIRDMWQGIERLGTYSGMLLAAGDDYSGMGGEFWAGWYPNSEWHLLGQDDIAAWTTWGGQLIEADVNGEVRCRPNVDYDPIVLGSADGYLNDLVVWQDQLVAVGDFSAVDDVEAQDVASFDGTNWHTLGQPPLWLVSAAVVYDGELVVGGSSPTAIGNLARWDGEHWSPLGAGVNGHVSDLVVYRGNLVAVGDFSQAGGEPAARVAVWDGQNWWPCGAGADAEVLTAAVYQDDLYLGGRFSEVDGVPSPGIARWRHDPLVVTPATPVASPSRILGVSPNPCNPLTTISFSLRRAGNASLRVYDLRGRAVRTVRAGHLDAGDHAATWNGNDDRGVAVASGIYLLKLITVDGQDVKKIVLAR